MISKKDHKTPTLVDPWWYLGAKRRKLLETSWAGLFQREILPILPIEILAPCFHAETGRPGKELHTALGVLVLQQQLDLTDLETVEQLAFNELWHYALNITDESDYAKYMCPRTLWGLRDWAVERGVANELFARITDKLAAVFTVDTTQQRLDSVHTKSNMRRLGRIGILARTIRKFLVNLKRHYRELFAELPAGLVERFLSKQSQSVFSMVKPSASAKTLAALSQDLYLLVERFSGCEDVARMTSYQLLKRVLDEQCAVVQGGADEPVQVAVKLPKEIAAGSLQNPADPDAGYSGHKGQGYSTQVMETYTENKAATTLNLITYVDVTAANVSDATAVTGALAEARERELGPAAVLADSLYGGDENRQAAEKQGTELVAPVMGQPEKNEIKLADFEYAESGAVIRCPLGQTPVKCRQSEETDHRTALFEAAACQACPRRGACPVKSGKKHFTLHYTDRAVRSSQRRAVEQTEAFKDRYRFRSGIEATMSELDRRTGLKRLRVRGLAAVRFCAKLKAAGLNILRAAAVQAARMVQAAQAAEPALTASVEAAIAPIFVLLGSLLSIFKEPFGRNPKRIVFPGHATAETAYALPAAA
jgi:hypothetical protein